MAIVKSVDIKWNDRAINKIDKNAKEGLFSMAYDIAKQARENAPVVTGALRNSIRVEWQDSKTINVIAGGMVSLGRLVDYAWKVEQRSSKPHYMERAQKAIMTGNYLEHYFGKVTK